MRNTTPSYLIIGITLLISCSTFINSKAQSNFNYAEKYKVKIKKTTEIVKVDGELNEAVWKKADVASGFWQSIYRDDTAPKYQTEIQLTYNDQYIFVGITCFDTLPYINSTLKRDTRPNYSDVLALMLDPMNQHASAFIFCVSAYNVQYEDMYSTSYEINWTWDNKWISATKQYKDRWTSEMAIPFKSLRYPAGKKQWALNFIRGDQKNAQWSLWTKIPMNIQWADLGYFGTLDWDMPPPDPGKNISFIPYISGSMVKDNENSKALKIKSNAGFDAKLALSTNLNLDLTVNPDFSQIEVDQQVTNLTRFNIFFPEKRTFFLENADLYADLGYAYIRPFYSRRIGIDPDGTAVPIIGGARLSGNLNKKLRVGIMNMQTVRKNEFAAQNYTALVLKQRLLKRSGLNAYFLNQQAFLPDSQKLANPSQRYNRNAGLEAQFTSNTGKWKTFGALHYSSKPGIESKNFFINAGTEFSTRKTGALIHYNAVGTNYYADMGFIGRIDNYDALLDTLIRLGFKQLTGKVSFKAFPQNGIINSHVWTIDNQSYFNPNGSLNDHSNSLGYTINFKNTSIVTVGLERTDTRLLYHTKFTTNAPLSPGKYVYQQLNANFRSDNRKIFTLNAGFKYGSFYNGNIFSINGEVKFRQQPWGNFSLLADYNKLSFPLPYGNAELLLLSSKTEIGFNTRIFWTTYFQYNTQLNNFNIHSRFQWRYQPMSDMFIVYTDNYFSQPFFKNRTRAIIFKLNYWLNL